MLRFILGLFAGLSLLLAACSPVHNWREVRLHDAALQLLMPCKPDQASRTLPMAGLPVEMQMAGCEAGAALYAISNVSLADASKTALALEQWKTAMLSNMQALDIMPLPALTIQGAGAKTPATRLAAQGKRPDGSVVAAQAIWFANDARLYHAVVYAEKLNQEAVDTFFSGIELP